MLDYWTHPPLDPIIKIYVFNYSNIDAVENGVDKLIKLSEVGPFVYRERTEKTGLKFEGHKITYYVRNFRDVKELSDKVFLSLLGKSNPHISPTSVGKFERR